MEELKLRSKYPDSLKPFVEAALTERLRSIETGIKRTQERLQEFETKYQLSTAEFLRRFENDEFNHTFDFDEWMGEAWMLESLLQEKEEVKGIEIVD